MVNTIRCNDTRKIMKHKIIMLSELGVECWSANRFFDKCYACDKVAYCKLPEAHEGRITLAENKVETARKVLAKAIETVRVERDKE